MCVGESIPLTNDNNAAWYGTVSVGNPPVQFTVVFDTGSADLILPGKNCKSGCDGHKQYDTGVSSTSRALGKSFKKDYGEESVISGEQVTDTVSIGEFIAEAQTLGVATHYPPNFQHFQADGILGLAFGSISVFPATPVLENLQSEDKKKPSVFAFKLAETGSELMVGGTNDKLYTGEFTNVPVTKQGYWQTTLDAIVVNGKSLFTNLEAVIDTGSTRISLTLKQAQEFYGTIPGSKDASAAAGPGHYSFPCDDFPEVALTFGGKSFKMSKETLSLGKLSEGSNECIGSIVGEDTGMDAAVIGTAFLQNVYTAFDLGKNQIGFADLPL